MTQGTILAGLLLLTAWAYVPLASADFVYEDRNPLVAMSPSTPIDNRGPWAGWTTERRAFSPQPRALANLTIRAQGWASASAAGYHLGNLAIHLVNGALLWCVLTPFGVPAQTVGVLLFLLHPINAEAVAYVSARPDLLAATGVLLVVLASARDDALGVVGVTVAGGLALLAKESAIVVVGLFPLWLLMRGRWSPRWAVPLGIWAVAGLAVVYRLVHIPACIATKGAPCHPVASHWGAMALYTTDAAHGALGFAAIQSAALLRLLALVVWPVGFSIDHDVDIVPMTVGVIALLGLGLGLVLALRAWRRLPWLTFAACWLAISLSLRFVMPMPEYLHEHHLYVPLLGIWIALACTVSAEREAYGEFRRVQA